MIVVRRIAIKIDRLIDSYRSFQMEVLDRAHAHQVECVNQVNWRVLP